MNAKKIQVIDISLQPAPGALAKVYRAFQEANVNITASWGYEMGPGQANAHFHTQDHKKAMDTLTKMGMKPKANSAIWVDGTDKVGAYADTLNKIEKAGVNIHATDALALGGKWATVLFMDESDIPKACKALGC